MNYTYTTESGLMDDIYDYIFGNDANIGICFSDEFPNSFVDTKNACIYLSSPELGNFKLKIERA